MRSQRMTALRHTDNILRLQHWSQRAQSGISLHRLPMTALRDIADFVAKYPDDGQPTENSNIYQAVCY